VKKINAAFNARFFVPEEHLSVLEKKELVRGYELGNNHEKDALAAALKAYNMSSAKLRNIEKRLGRRFEEDVRSLFSED
jgi:predicted RNase H-like nuclease (RuvC/YqgF family)